MSDGGGREDGRRRRRVRDTRRTTAVRDAAEVWSVSAGRRAAATAETKATLGAD